MHPDTILCRTAHHSHNHNNSSFALGKAFDHERGRTEPHDACAQAVARLQSSLRRDFRTSRRHDAIHTHGWRSANRMDAMLDRLKRSVGFIDGIIPFRLVAWNVDRQGSADVSVRIIFRFPIDSPFGSCPT